MRKLAAITIAFSMLLTTSNASAFISWWPFLKGGGVTASNSTTTYTKTKYPIVLVHGLSGFNSLGGVINYFHNIPYNLRRSGATVYVPSVSPFNSSEVRGQQLANYLIRLGGTKYNLMGHSQGAPTSRVAASLVPHKVASVTSISGVNLGSDVADVVLGRVPPGSSRQIIGQIANSAGRLINFFSGSYNHQNSIASALTLSYGGTYRLNNALDWKGVSPYCRSLPEDVNISGYNIKMFSWGGSTPFTNYWDVSDYILGFTSKAFRGKPNDGLTDTCSQKLGKVISVNYHLNHLDAVNHIFGIRGATDPISIYRTHANRLSRKNL